MNALRLSRAVRAAAASIGLALLLAGCGRSANVSTRNTNPVSRNSGGQVIAAAGTTFYGNLQQPISSKANHDGDTFSLAQTDTLLHREPALHGSVLNGHLEGVKSAGPLRKPALTLVFDNLTLADGTKAPVNVRLVSMKAFEAKSHRLRTLGMMVGGSIAAHQVAKRTGGKSHGLMGMAGGYLLSQTLKTDISVPAGTVLELKFMAPVTAAGS
jgi:hypothetical protein